MAEKLSRGMAVLGLGLNFCVMPGLGTMLAKNKTKTGITQFVSTLIFGLIFLVAWVFNTQFNARMSNVLYSIPILLVAVVWFWSILTGIQMIKESE